MKKIRSINGFTLVELVIASMMLLVLLSVISTSFVSFASGKRKVVLSVETYNETRFLLERIVREVHNGTIDYQGYWKENLLMKSDVGGNTSVSENWLFETDSSQNNYETINKKGVKPNFNLAALQADGHNWGLNTIRNCETPGFSLITSEHTSETNSITKQTDIMYNYRNQFIYPGQKRVNGGNTETNFNGASVIHLNCQTDNYNQGDGYNVYDDEPAFGQGPRAINNSGAYDKDINYADSNNMFWTWDLTQNAVKENNPPLLLVKANADKTTYTRTALRFKNNKIEMMRFIAEPDNDSPPDNIPDMWKCEENFECNNLYDASYIWSQKATTGAGLGSISDPLLSWKNITPEKLDIIRMDFILSPVKDPNFAFYESDKKQKPQVTIIIEAQATKASMRGIKGKAPRITLQTTATPRIWDHIIIDN